MKIDSSLLEIEGALGRALLTVLLMCSSSYAQTYSWNSTTASSWGTGTNWSPNAVPSTGDTLISPSLFGNANMDADRSVGAIDVSLPTNWTITPGSSGTPTWALNVGSITKAGAATLSLGSGSATRVLNLNASTITVNAGTIDIAVGTNTNISGLVTLNGGNLRIPSTSTIRNFDGGVTFGTSASANFDINRSTVNTNTKVAFLSGGGSGSIVQSSSNAGSGSIGTLEIHGNSGTNAFAGIIQDGSGTRVTAVTKTGNNTQVFNRLTGSTYTGGTTISAGTMLYNNTSGSGTGTGSVLVQSSGTLGGSGILAGATIVDSGAFLAPGGDGTAATFTFGSTLDIAGLAGGPSGGLLFDLGASSDLIRLTSGVLNIGSGVLNFNDFDFSMLAGFGAGTYTLLDATVPISGTLGSNLSGTIGSFSGTLSLANSNNDLVLTVVAVPEPSTMAIALGGLMALVLRRRRGDLRSA